MTFRADLRIAVCDLLRDYRASINSVLQVYEGRPRKVQPPTAFIDSVREDVEYVGPLRYQRTLILDIIFLHGVFDSKDAVMAVDDFVDGFLAYVVPLFHASGGNTLTEIVGVEDEPTYVPDWLPDEERKTYYATRISVRGYAEI